MEFVYDEEANVKINLFFNYLIHQTVGFFNCTYS